jgi:DNA polymerase sigma
MTLRLLRDGTIASSSMTMSADPNPVLSQQTPVHAHVSAGTIRITPPTRQHSRSMPSTPSQKPHPDGNGPRSPSQHRNLNNISPRSLQSDVAQIPYRKQCKYETGMARARRRVPYKEGPDKLEPDPSVKNRRLSLAQEEKLSRDMRELYNELIPTPESEHRRSKFLAKLERLLSDRWPNSSIKVNVFGSTGNCLGTLASDIDVCITTDNSELSQVCSIAELLANQGMERVVCVSRAKVPIVKVWDPELQVACDLNVNNPIALENTSLVRSYVAIDDRVRPLAMIIKHWAKRRILNDAGR